MLVLTWLEGKMHKRKPVVPLTRWYTVTIIFSLGLQTAGGADFIDM